MSALMGFIAAVGVFCVVLAAQAIQYVGSPAEWREDRRICLTADAIGGLLMGLMIFFGEWFG